ncbi:MAG: thioredoxin family protein [Rhodothermales bacterium]
MKHLLSLLVLCIVATGVSAQDASVPAEGLDWIPFEEAVEKAERLDKKLIVDVYAPWCPWCRRLQREVYVDASVQDYVKEHFVLTRLDGENQSDSLRFREYTLTPSELAIGLGAQGYPTTVFLDADGEYITRLPGFAEASSFLSVLSYVGSNAFQQVSFDEYRTRDE